MSKATKCDRYGGYFEQGGKNVRQGWGSMSNEYDLCPDCAESFDAWMECHPVTDEPERVTNQAETLHDTREKLEADVRRKQREWSQSPYALDTNVYEVIGWLDRQAAITRKECNALCGTCATEQDERIAELEAFAKRLEEAAKHGDDVTLFGVDYVPDSRYDTLREHAAGQAEQLRRLTDKCAELRKYRDEWMGLAEKYRADSIAAQAECEKYRAKLGDVLDAIHEAERVAR